MCLSFLIKQIRGYKRHAIWSRFSMDSLVGLAPQHLWNLFNCYKVPSTNTCPSPCPSTKKVLCHSLPQKTGTRLGDGTASTDRTPPGVPSAPWGMPCARAAHLNDNRPVIRTSLAAWSRPSTSSSFCSASKPLWGLPTAAAMVYQHGCLTQVWLYSKHSADAQH